MGKMLIVAEKPSVGRDIARVLGCRTRQEGYLDGETACVTWAVGHLVTLQEPDELDSRYKRWRAEDLPILPEDIPLKVVSQTKKQYKVVEGLLRSKEIDRVVCATDAGREGELIFRYIYRMARCDKPFDRLWISSMTDEAIREGFARLKPGADYDALYQSARCRSEADWLVGMNASRAFTLRYGVLLSLGRVQTPTLQLLVKRRKEIEAFDPRPYYVIRADFGDYQGVYLDPATQEKRVYDPEQAEEIAKAVRGKPAAVQSVTREQKRELPPLLYDLTTLQRDANRLLGLTAKRTLETAQSLYETHKLITYPRTDSKHLTEDLAPKLPQALRSLPEPLAGFAKPLLEAPLPRPKRIFDADKVSDHHAILPTGKTARLEGLKPEERDLFMLVARRLVAAFYPEYQYEACRVMTRAEGHDFVSTGRTVLNMGWKALYADVEDAKSKKKADEDADQTLPDLKQGDGRTVIKATVRQDKTKPPPPLTDATLLQAMEQAGREVEDEALREAMRGSGLGTPATRAAIIERLIQVGYAARKGKALTATDKGVQLIEVAPPDIAQPETTGRWEKALSDIAAGGMQPERFLAGIRRLAGHLVQQAQTQQAQAHFEPDPLRTPRTALAETCPLCGQARIAENSKAFYCLRWKQGCGFKVWKDAVTAMGGPMLTKALMARLLKEGSLRGSTGTLRHEKGRVTFEPRPGTAADNLSGKSDRNAEKPPDAAHIPLQADEGGV